jgi:hypothetical protein
MNEHGKQTVSGDFGCYRIVFHVLGRANWPAEQLLEYCANPEPAYRHNDYVEEDRAFETEA